MEASAAPFQSKWRQLVEMAMSTVYGLTKITRSKSAKITADFCYKKREIHGKFTALILGHIVLNKLEAVH